mmetsp:Transcript_14996/g.22661  ORF Transcript_14996/g.22661 Transcript_14996/m.22661 type:complete len:426 (+) Transcript_14996:106-1383(+)
MSVCLALLVGLCAYICSAAETEQNTKHLINTFDKSDDFFPQSLNVALISFKGQIFCSGALIQPPKGDNGHYVMTAASCFWSRKLHKDVTTVRGDAKVTYHASGNWKVRDVKAFKVQFGVTPTAAEPVAECKVVDILINPRWTTETFSSEMSDRENDFAIVVLNPDCALGEKFAPFSAVGASWSLFKPQKLIRAAYTPEKQLVAYLETRYDGYPWLLRTGVKGSSEPATFSERGAPVWTAAQNGFLYAMYLLGGDSHLSLKLAYIGGSKTLEDYMRRKKGLSPLFESYKECSDTNTDASSCWGKCGGSFWPCWVKSDGTKKRETRMSKPCAVGKEQKLCGVVEPVEPAKRRAAKPGKDATSQLFGAKAKIDLYSDMYDDDAYDEAQLTIEQDLDEELDEMLDDMFMAGYSKGLEQRERKQKYRYQY